MRLTPTLPSPAEGRQVTVTSPETDLLHPVETVEGVRQAQNQLLDAGYSLPLYGADGHFGRETSAALKRFQNAHGLAQTGLFDDQTLQALEKAATSPPSPAYQALFADGVLRATMAIGYDEALSHQYQQAEVRRGLAQRGYREATLRERKQLSLDAAGHYFIKALPLGAQKVTAVVELVTPDTTAAKSRFAQAMRQSEVVLYGGHGRYGSGPDFDDIRSAAGNFVIGQPFEAGHVTLGANDLEAAPLTPAYQLMFFDGCNTFRYFDDLRARTPGKTTRNLDVIGSNTELYWNVTAANLLAMLDGLARQRNLGQLEDALDQVNRENSADGRRFFRGDGFEDN